MTNLNKDDTPSSPLRRSSHQGDDNGTIPVAYKVGSDQTDANVVVTVLEDAIQTCEEEFVVDEVTPEEIEPPYTCCQIMLEQFKWPVMALIVVTGSAVGVIYSQLPVLYQYFPYYATLINFLGGVPSTKGSMDNMAFAVIPRLEQMERRIQQTARQNQSKANAGYQSYTTYVRQQSQVAIEYVKEKLPPKMTKSASTILASTGNALQSYDISQSKIQQDLDTNALIGKNDTKTILCPAAAAPDADVNQNDDDFDPESSDNNKDKDENILRGSRYVCLPFQSYELFVFFVELPILTFLLIGQLLMVWYFQAIFNGATTYQDYETGDFVLIDSKRLAPLKYSITTFAVVMVQISIAKLCANASRVAKIINVRLQNRAKDMQTFKQHLAACMIFLKKQLVKFLEFVTNTKKLKEFTSSAMTGLQASLTKAIEWTGMSNPKPSTSSNQQQSPQP